jgi:hypothetical protein
MSGRALKPTRSYQDMLDVNTVLCEDLSLDVLDTLFIS